MMLTSEQIAALPPMDRLLASTIQGRLSMHLSEPTDDAREILRMLGKLADALLEADRLRTERDELREVVRRFCNSDVAEDHTNVLLMVEDAEPREFDRILKTARALLVPKEKTNADE